MKHHHEVRQINYFNGLGFQRAMYWHNQRLILQSFSLLEYLLTSKNSIFHPSKKTSHSFPVFVSWNLILTKKNSTSFWQTWDDIGDRVIPGIFYPRHQALQIFRPPSRHQAETVMGIGRWSSRTWDSVPFKNKCIYIYRKTYDYNHI